MKSKSRYGCDGLQDEDQRQSPQDAKVPMRGEVGYDEGKEREGRNRLTWLKPAGTVGCHSQPSA